MGELSLPAWPRKGRKQGNVYCIEGENVSMAQIAARLGCSVAAASVRMSKLRKLPGAITWKRLGR